MANATRRAVALPPGRVAAVGAALERVQRGTDMAARLAADPVSIVRRYTEPLEQELVAMLTASLAFGNAKAFRQKIEEVLRRLGPDTCAACDDYKQLCARLFGVKHRMHDAKKIASLLASTRDVQREHGSLGTLVEQAFQRTGSVESALHALVSAINDKARGRVSLNHLLSDVSRGSASKRLWLLMRWMVRPDDGVDLGRWNLPTDQLLMPVDTHVHKLSLNLGLTRRRSADLATSKEITRALGHFDASDPVRYDFALCHLGMAGDCPSRKDEKRCKGCGIQSACRHWAPKRNQ